jgi:phage-related tail fiber protein
MDEYTGILTTAGAAIFADAVATGNAAQITNFVIGDGNGDSPAPDKAQTALVNQVYTGQLNRLSRSKTNPAVITAEAVLSADAGPFWMREMGLVASDGTLVAVTALPPQYKIKTSSGSAASMVITMDIIVSEEANVTLLIDESVVLATREYVQEYVEEQIGNIDGQASREYVDEAMSAHESAENPHPQYLPVEDTVAGVTQVPTSIDGVFSQKMIQRGIAVNNATALVEVVFPEKFPMKCENISLTFFNEDYAYDGASGLISGINYPALIECSPTGFKALVMKPANGYFKYATEGRFFWTAEGY